MAKLITEYRELADTNAVIEESNGGQDKKYYITGSFLKVDTRNQNGNLYPRDVVIKCIEEFNTNKIQKNRAVGELNHPHTPDVDLNNIAVLIESLELVGDDVMGKARVASKGPGERVKGLIDDGLNFGVSLRALGTLDEEKVMQDGMHLIAIDLVSDPSFATSFVDPILESKEYVLDGDFIVEGHNVTTPVSSKAPNTSTHDVEAAFSKLFKSF
jgi:hypothetical protein